MKIRLKGLLKGLIGASFCFILLYFFRFSLVISGFLANFLGKSLAGLLDFVISLILGAATAGWLYVGIKQFFTDKELISEEGKKGTSTERFVTQAQEVKRSDTSKIQQTSKIKQIEQDKIFEFICSSCERRLQTDGHRVGEKGRCPYCGNIFKVPKKL